MSIIDGNPIPRTAGEIRDRDTFAFDMLTYLPYNEKIRIDVSSKFWGRGTLAKQSYNMSTLLGDDAIPPNPIDTYPENGIYRILACSHTNETGIVDDQKLMATTCQTRGFIHTVDANLNGNASNQPTFTNAASGCSAAMISTRIGEVESMQRERESNDPLKKFDELKKSPLGRRFMTNIPRNWVQFRVSDLSTFNPNTNIISVNYTMNGSMVLVNYPVVSAYEQEYCVLEWGTNKRTIIHSKNPTTIIENTGSFTLTYYQRKLLTTNPTTYGYRLATLSEALFNGDVDKWKGKELPIRMISYS